MLTYQVLDSLLSYQLKSLKDYLLGFLLELLDGTLVDTTALVDQVTGGC